MVSRRIQLAIVGLALALVALLIFLEGPLKAWTTSPGRGPATPACTRLC